MAIGQRLRSAVSDLLEMRRRVWSGHGLTFIEARSLTPSQARELDDALVDAFASVDGVRWARFNRALHRVVVAHDDGAEASMLSRQIGELERELGAGPFLLDPPPFPGDSRPLLLGAVETAADAAGLLVAGLLRLGRFRVAPAQIDLEAVVTLLRNATGLGRPPRRGGGWHEHRIGSSRESSSMSETAPRVLVCEDDPLIRTTMAADLREMGFEPLEARDGHEALAVMDLHSPACLILDLRMPRLGGLDMLRELRRRGDATPVLVLTADDSVSTAVEAARLGAYMEKPADPDRLRRTLRRLLDAEDDAHRSRGRPARGYGEFLGRSPVLEPLYDALERLESVDASTVLILGESGTGKDVLARMIHARGPRREERFVEIDCTTLPGALVESELFGHERGAFTDARATKQGLLEVAGRGVVFLDEIGELELSLQAKLLRALEGRRFKRVGAVNTRPFEATVIAATNRNLALEVGRGRFREDLFYRLAVVVLTIPPLRQRPEDVPLLIDAFLAQLRARRSEVEGVTPGAMKLMQRYAWPGNVRELRNMLERITLLGVPGGVIREEDLPAEIRKSRGPRFFEGRPTFELPRSGISLAEVERSFVAQALERTGGNKAAAAELLGISRYQLRNRAKKYDLLDDGD